MTLLKMLVGVLVVLTTVWSAQAVADVASCQATMTAALARAENAAANCAALDAFATCIASFITSQNQSKSPIPLMYTPTMW